MVDDRRREARRIHGNVTSGGRFGEAPDDKHHIEPEVAPLGIDSAEVHPPEAIPGALPENAGDHKAELLTPPRDKGVVRMPEATAEALTGEE